MHKPLALVLALAACFPTRSDAAEIAIDEFTLFKLKLGGFFYGAAHFDSNSAANRPWVNVVGSNAGRGAFSFDPYGTRTNLGIESANSEGPKARGFLEIDWGPVTSPRIRHAYVAADYAFLSVLIGQYWVPALIPGPDTYNPQWLFKGGNAYSRAPQLAVSAKFRSFKATALITSGSLLGGSVVKGNGAAGSYALTESVNLTGMLQLSYSFLGKGFVAVAAGAGRADANYLIAAGDRRPNTGAETAYGELAFSVPISILTVSGKIFHSVGMGMGTGVGQTLVVTASDRASPVRSWGGFLSLRASFTKAISTAAYLGIDDPFDTERGVAVPIRRNLTLGANVTYAITQGAVVALEVVRVATLTATATGEEEFTDVRPSLVARYSF